MIKVLHSEETSGSWVTIRRTSLLEEKMRSLFPFTGQKTKKQSNLKILWFFLPLIHSAFLI
jgi:hypothetical protein